MYLQSRHGPIPLEGLPLTEDQRDRLELTLRLLPAAHLRALTRIVIRDRQVVDEDTGERREYAGGSTNAVQEGWRRMAPGERQFWIMIDIDSFDPHQRAINARPGRKHYTLLHEIGHLVDWSFGAFRWIQAHDPAGYAAIARAPHRGITPGAQERFADAYADLWFYPPERTRDDPRIQAILRSPAFHRIWSPFTTVTV